ncbi:Fe-S cluster assembly protein SufD [Thioalkalivibrio sp. XN8]|uniref:Fe-S cluster assembly protein SufD n=1 Tax=Thioalkalivibrio sp. XN8 TaxID=2712863 RepID=UPI0013EB3264|nr:Fe-S cluster assembly protein SufD [Thioalkalivibrio sp. XN8]NGP54321.1 Fe-S cluster assembly protein SufD [Thioalkalivibrio sp. XN8]
MSTATAARGAHAPALPDWIEHAAAAAAGPAWLQERRRAGLAAFAAAGFPTRRDEAWKYTDLKLVTRRSFGAGIAAAPELPAIEGLDCPSLVFVNGRLAASHGVPQAVGVQPLAAAIAADDPACRELLATIADPARHRFAALSTALFADGVLVDLPAGTVLEQPLRLVFLAAAGDTPVLECPRVLIRAGANSRATVIEHYGAGTGESLSLAVTEVAAGPGAMIEHYRLQESAPEAFHLGVLAARLERDSTLVSHNLSVGGRIARLDLDAALAEPGAHVTMNGLYVVRERQHADSHSRVDHAVPRTSSDQLYRGVLSGKSRAVFNGKAVVHPGAAGTDAQQSNANLLLSPDAEIDTKPELEIYADDVKCSHGATTGQLDANALFYLRSRGVDESTARSLLTFAFADVVLARMPLAPLRRHAEQLVVGRLPDADRIREFT